MEYITDGLESANRVGREIASWLFGQEPQMGATLVGLYGELGAGKTTFTQIAAEYAGVTEKVVSPTFVIEKIYNLGFHVRPYERLIHIDAYRLEKSDELLKLGWKEIISDPRNIIFIEWPERVENIMPEHIKITFEHRENKEERRIRILNNFQ